jgi:hypothetical protein
MEYAVTLYFNKTVEEKINNLIFEIAENNGNKYMVDNKIFPHLTISLFEYNDNVDLLIDLLDKNIPEINIGFQNIMLFTIGIFVPNVLYIAPIVNKNILELNEKINGLLNSNKGIILDKYYSNNLWVPHVSLGVKLNKNELQNGINVLINNFQGINAEIKKIALEECNPLKEIKTWDL